MNYASSAIFHSSSSPATPTSADLAQSLSTLIARSSGHAIYHDRPGPVTAEISRLTLYQRGGPAPPFATTTTE